jgi:hypothetical protein
MLIRQDDTSQRNVLLRHFARPALPSPMCQVSLELFAVFANTLPYPNTNIKEDYLLPSLTFLFP